MPDFGTETIYTGKTINPVNNTMPYYGPTAFSIHPHGGNVQLRNNGTGVTTSYATLGPAINAVLANTNDPSVTIHSGWYDLASGFTGWNIVAKTKIICEGNVFINVPQGYADAVYFLSPSVTNIYSVVIDGGFYDEQGTQTNNWICVHIGPTNDKAVFNCKIRNLEVWRANTVIYVHTTNNSWINENVFEDIWGQSCKYLSYWEHTGTYTLNLSGPNQNTFRRVSLQSTSTDGTNHYPQTLGGIIGVFGQWNEFYQCNIWDLQAANSSASSMTIGANGNQTMIKGGLLTHRNYSNLGTLTSIDDTWNGILTQLPLNVKGAQAVFNGPSTDYLSALVVNKTASTGFENIASYGINSSTDTFTIENGTNQSGTFNTILRAINTSTNALATLTSLYISGYIKNANDVVNTVPVVELSARQAAGNLVNRPMVGISNHFDPKYLFYPTYMDYLTNGIKNANINPTNNILPFHHDTAYYIYREAGSIRLQKTSDGSITTYTSLGPAVAAVVADTANPSVTIADGFYQLAGGFAGWDCPKKTHIRMGQNTIIWVPAGYTGYVFRLINDANCCKIEGGLFDENDTKAWNWTLFKLNPTTGTNGVYWNVIKDVQAWRCKYPIHLLTDATTFINDNMFQNCSFIDCKNLIKFEHTSTFTTNQSGSNANHFIDIRLQAGVVASGQISVEGGITGVNGDYNKFDNCILWDLEQNNASAPWVTITSNARYTTIDNGILTYMNFTDNGTATRINDFMNWKEGNTLRLNKTAQSSGAGPEQFLNFTVSDASGDSFSLENAWSTDAIFSPLLRGTAVAAGHNSGTNAMYLQGVINPTNDTTNTAAAVVLGAKNSGNTALVNRPMLGIHNLFTPVYNFYPGYADFTGKEIRNVIQAGTRNADNSISSNTTLTSTHSVVRCDANSAGFIVTLPSAASVAGTVYTIIKTDNTNNVVTIATTSSQTIGGVATWYLRIPGRYLIVESDGTNWKVIGFVQPQVQGIFRKGSTPDRTYIAGLSPYTNAALVTSTTGPTVNTLYAMPILISEITKFDVIRCQVTTLGSGSNLRMGIYYDDGNMYPGKLLYDSSNISAASNGVKSSTITPGLQTFQPGVYWLAYENSATIPQIKALPGANTCWYFAGADNSIALGTSTGFAYTVAHTVGALPDPYTAGGTLRTADSSATSPVPAVGLRAVL